MEKGWLVLRNERAFTFSDLRVHYGTGRSYTVSGTGRNRVTGYRIGMKCDAGDLEESEWKALVKDLIARAGEQELYKQLYSFMEVRNYVRASKSELEREVLQLHAARIFDNLEWVYYAEFNQMCRPEVLSRADLVRVKMACCGETGLVTQQIVDRCLGQGMVPCPICGKWSEYDFVEVEKRSVP